MKSSSEIRSAIGLAAIVSAVRWVFECWFVVSLVPDPQSPIWIMVSSIVSIVMFATVGVAAWVALRAMRSRWKILSVAAWVPLLGLLVWYSTGLVHLAENPNTPVTCFVASPPARMHGLSTSADH